jgi:D-3-phosphoglycerate dehydrogenase
MSFKIVNLDTCFGWPEGYAQERALTASLPMEWVMLKVVTEDEIIAVSHEADVVLVERFSTKITQRVIDALDRCRLIAKYAIGVDNIDIAAATEHGIVVCNAADYCVEEVSDHTVALLLACARRIVTIDRHVQRAGWHDVVFEVPLRRIRALTLGLVGFGRIARQVAQKFRGFGLRILAADPYVPKHDAAENEVELVSLNQLLRESDLISMHTPLTPETHKLIGQREFEMMKSSAFLVNTSRGAILDESALIRRLREGRIAGVALDVAEIEPLPANSPLRGLPNVILTAHYAGDSVESLRDVHRTMGESISSVLQDYWPPFPVNSTVTPRVPLKVRSPRAVRH